ncbi:MAG TPA: succinylglutamate desuccinylase/aspartoacylase family protein [Gemmatimonadaceae bacterium]|nr:succinylglutamate desuccinylase/aspartoacylase family protein [Gemmatimonadaceae bacterium]
MRIAHISVACAALFGAIANPAASQGRSNAATPADPKPTATVGTAIAKRGETAYGEIVVPPSSDAGTSMAVAVIHGTKPGKTVAFIAGSHGTEYASSVALSRLIARIDATKLTGTVIIMPMLNVASFEQMIVHLNPVDKKGMNRVYPGNPAGTQSDRALDLIARHVVEQSDVVVDLHGGDIDEDLRQYSYWTRTGNRAQDSASRALVLAFGLNHIIVRDVDAAAPTGSRTLGGYSLARGKTVIVGEAGRSGTVIQADVDALINGSLNVLGALSMIARPVRPVTPVWLADPKQVAATKTEMFFATVARDARVTNGQVIGYTTDFLGRRTGEIKAPATGVVTFIRGVPSTWPGAALVTVSEIMPTLPPYKSPAAQAPSPPPQAAASYEVYAINYATLEKFRVSGLVAGADTSRRMDIAMMVWLLKGASGRNVLVDAGFQPRENLMRQWRPAAYMRPDSAVTKFGVAREAITDVIVSHVHWDHFDGAELFPNARIWIQKDEVEHHIDSAGTVRDRTINAADAAMLHQLRASGRVQLVDGDAREIIPGITVFTGGKHTFQSQYASVRIDGGTVVIASDNMYLYENLDKHVPIAATLDATSNLAAQDRMKTLASSPRLIVPGHDPAVLTRFTAVAPGVVRIR